MDPVLETRRALAAKYAAKYGLETELVCALAEQESSWNPWTYRYEPAFYDKYIIPLGLSEGVGRFRATSWGLCQVMGQTARELGFVGEFMSELCNPEVGMEYGCRKLRKCFDKHSDEHAALQAYNGGSNLKYADEVIARKAKYAVS